MRKSILVAVFIPAFLVAAGVFSVRADAAPPAGASLPHRGQTMSAVQRALGQPQIKHAAVGGGSPQHPPITRWDYMGFSVFFEYDHVVDTVVPDQPPPVFNTEELKPAASS